VRGAHALFPEERVRHSERGRDPAIRVHWPGGKPVHDALDRVAHVLRGRHHYRARKQHDSGERDVHPENGAIDGHRLPFDELSEPAQQLQHVAGDDYKMTTNTITTADTTRVTVVAVHRPLLSWHVEKTDRE